MRASANQAIPDREMLQSLQDHGLLDKPDDADFEVLTGP